MQKIQVGIDLGTTNTLAYARRKGKMKPIGKMLPSVMYVEKNDDGSIKEIVGKTAKMKGLVDPDNYISSSKTYIGLTGVNKKTWKCHDREYTPTDVAAKILEEVHKKVRETYDLEEGDIVQAVITIPAYFTSTQSDETKRAGERAGMEVLRIITEPVAAALAAAEDVKGKIFVVDLGGGTFDVSVLNIGEKYQTLEIAGERKLGGDDFDDILVNFFVEHIEDDLMIDLSSLEASGLGYSDYYVMMSKIRSAAVEMKEGLSESDEYEVNEPALLEYGENKKYDFSMTLSREDFNELCKPLFERILKVIKETVENSDKFELSEIKKVFLVGGSCYIPKIQEDVEEYFGMPAYSDQDIATLVAMGAGKIADAWDGFTAEEGRVDPFEDMLQDIISHDMGIEIYGKNDAREFSCILPKNSNYPCKVKKFYKTWRDNQENAIIKVYEKTVSGASDFFEKDMAAYDFYGSFELTGLVPALAGETIVEVTFDYDNSRTLTVTAEDTTHHISQTVELHKGENISETSSSVTPTDFYVLIDTSGSMRGEKIKAAQKACSELVNNTLDLSVHRLGIITFGDAIKLMSGLTKNKQELQLAIDRIDVFGMTFMDKAIDKADEMFKNNNNKKAIIIVTDGLPNSKSATTKAAERIRKNDVSIATIGVKGADMKYLSELSQNDELNFKVDNISKLSETFGKAVENLLKK